MQTNFTLAQLADPNIETVNGILRACVHCGFCTATCPTYVLLGDELDSPRGRIYQIKDMLERDQPASAEVVKHVDRCLSCLSCMTTCPSGVHYMHLVDHGRAHIEKTFKRPFVDKWLRNVLAILLPNPSLFRLALIAAWFAKPFVRSLPKRLRAMIELAPSKISGPSRVDIPQTFPAEGKRRARVALLSGCAQKVLNPQINEATVRLLTRHGVEVVVAQGAGCCGSLVHHLGRTDESHAQAAANIEAWGREMDGEGLDAIVVNASGCGTTVKDYGFMFRTDTALKDKAERVSSMALDVAEFLGTLDIDWAGNGPDLKVAYHAACSLQHGQKVIAPPKALLAAAGFDVRDVAEGHLCCGSAGTYNILQPELAAQLKSRKIANIKRTGADIIAAGNIGCITQIASGIDVPVVHTVELLDWATGGPKPAGMD